MKRYLKSAVVIFLTGFAILFGALAQAEGESQNIVLGLQGNPYFESAPACVAIQLGTLLLMQSNAEVTLFTSVEGVGIADAYALNKTKTICDTMNPQTGELGEAYLAEVVQNFLDAGGDILACPMCWAVYEDASKNKRAQLIPQCGSSVEGICSPHEGQVYSDNPAPLLLGADKSFDY